MKGIYALFLRHALITEGPADSQNDTMTGGAPRPGAPEGLWVGDGNEYLVKQDANDWDRTTDTFKPYKKLHKKIKNEQLRDISQIERRKKTNPEPDVSLEEIEFLNPEMNELKKKVTLNIQ